MSGNDEWTIKMKLETGKEVIKIKKTSIRNKGNKRVSSVHEEITEPDGIGDRKYRVMKFANGNCNDLLESEELVEYLLRLEGLVGKELNKDKSSPRDDDPTQKIRTVYLFRDDITRLVKTHSVKPGLSPKQVISGRQQRIKAVIPVIATHNYQFMMDNYRNIDTQGVRACSLENLMNGKEETRSKEDKGVKNLSKDAEERPYLKVNRTLPLAQALTIFYLAARKDQIYQKYGFLHQDITPDNVSVYCKEESVQEKKGTQRSFSTKLSIVDVDMIDKAMTRQEGKPLKALITGVVPVVAKEVEGYYGDEGEDSTAPFRGIESAPIEILLGDQYGNQETLAQATHNIYQVSNLLVRMVTGHHATFLSGDFVRTEIHRYQLFDGRINKIIDKDEKAKKRIELEGLKEKISDSVKLMIDNYRSYLSKEELATLNEEIEPENFNKISQLITEIKEKKYRSVLEDMLRKKLSTDNEEITPEIFEQIVEVMNKGTDEFPRRYKTYDEVITAINAVEKDGKLRSYSLEGRLYDIFQKGRARSMLSFQEPDVTDPNYLVDRTKIQQVVDSTVSLLPSSRTPARSDAVLFNYGVTTPKDKSKKYKRGIIGTGIGIGLALIGAGIFALGGMVSDQLFPPTDYNKANSSRASIVSPAPEETIVTPYNEKCATSEDDIKGYSSDVITPDVKSYETDVITPDVRSYETDSEQGEGVIAIAKKEVSSKDKSDETSIPTHKTETPKPTETPNTGKNTENSDFGTLETIPINVSVDNTTGDLDDRMSSLDEDKKIEANLNKILEKSNDNPIIPPVIDSGTIVDGKKLAEAYKKDTDEKTTTPEPKKEKPQIIKECKFRSGYSVGEAHVSRSISVNIEDIVTNCSDNERSIVKVYGNENIDARYNPNSGTITITPKKRNNKPFKGTSSFQVYIGEMKTTYHVEFTNQKPEAVKTGVVEVNEDQNRLIRWSELFKDADSRSEALVYELIEQKGGSTNSIIKAVATTKGVLIKTTKQDMHSDMDGPELKASSLAEIVLRVNDENSFVYNTIKVGVIPINDCPRANDRIAYITYIPKSSKGKFLVKDLFTDPEQKDQLIITTTTSGVMIPDAEKVGSYFYIVHGGADLKKVVNVKLEASDGIRGRCQIESGDIVDEFTNDNVAVDVYFHHWEELKLGHGYVLMARFLNGYLSGKKECTGYAKDLKIANDISHHIGQLAYLASQDKTIGDLFLQVAGFLDYSQGGKYISGKFNLVSTHAEKPADPEKRVILDDSLSDRSSIVKEVKGYLRRGLSFGQMLNVGNKCLEVKIRH